MRCRRTASSLAPLAVQLALGEGSALKHVRIWFSKTGTARYISHLDLNRCMDRAMHKAKIPLWYTEGFHPHAFMTFALPLSLFMDGRRESMDIKLEEEMNREELIARLNEALPPDIRIFDVTEPVMKPGKIAYASFVAWAEPEGEPPEALLAQIQALLRREEIVVEKRTKSGVKEMNIQPFFADMELTVENGKVKMAMTLPAGSTENVNPALLLEALKEYQGCTPYVRMERTGLYDANMTPFA